MNYIIMCNGSSTDLQNAADWISSSYEDWDATVDGSNIAVQYTSNDALLGSVGDSIVKEMMGKPPVQSADPTNYSST